MSSDNKTTISGGNVIAHGDVRAGNVYTDDLGFHVVPNKTVSSLTKDGIKGVQLNLTSTKPPKTTGICAQAPIKVDNSWRSTVSDDRPFITNMSHYNVSKGLLDSGLTCKDHV